MTMMLTWLGVDIPRLEGVRVVLGDRRMRAIGAVVSTANGDRAAYSATYSVSTGETGVVRRVSLRAVNTNGERQVTLNRSQDGIWLIDHGEGAERTEFDGALDVDVADCALFNALPVRRLGLHRQGGEHTLPVVYVRLPELSVHLVRQTYRSVPTVSGPRQSRSSALSFQQNDYAVDLTVDVDGLVVDYPGLARRV
jgi:uncharacterized protein